MTVEISRNISSHILSEPFTSEYSAPFFLSRIVAGLIYNYGIEDSEFLKPDEKSRSETRSSICQLTNKYSKIKHGELVGGGIHILIFPQGLLPYPHDSSFTLGIVAGGIFPRQIREVRKPNEMTRIIAMPIDEDTVKGVELFIRDSKGHTVVNSEWFDEDTHRDVKNSLSTINQNFLIAKFPLWELKSQSKKEKGALFFPLIGTCSAYEKWFFRESKKFLKQRTSKWYYKQTS